MKCNSPKNYRDPKGFLEQEVQLSVDKKLPWKKRLLLVTFPTSLATNNKASVRAIVNDPTIKVFAVKLKRTKFIRKHR